MVLIKRNDRLSVVCYSLDPGISLCLLYYSEVFRVKL